LYKAKIQIKNNLTEANKMFGRFVLSAIIIAIFTAFFFLFNLPLISYALLIGILLLMGFLPFGPIGGILGVVLCVVSGILLWGLGGALLVGGIAANYFGGALRGPEELAWAGPLITHSPVFQLITGPVAILAIIVGFVILVVRLFL
jgi:hypothetical protein